jgi:hypothetical protein
MREIKIIQGHDSRALYMFDLIGIIAPLGSRGAAPLCQERSTKERMSASSSMIQ